MMDNIYNIPFRVRSYEVDQQQKATVSSICNYFQEAAGLHAHHLNFDITQLLENGMTWVLHKMHVTIRKSPKRWEDISVTTWPSAGDGLRAFRDYELKNSGGEVIAAAISQWIVLNVKSQRPVRIPDEISELGITGRDHTIKPDKKPLSPLSADRSKLVTVVNSSDLDMNNHVNNVRYIDWMLGYLPGHVTDGRRCSEFEIQYYSESVKGDTIYLAVEQSEASPGKIKQTLFKNEDRKVIAASVSEWR